MDRARSVGAIKCNVCMEEFQTTINYLSEAVDVYSDWVDACEKENACFGWTRKNDRKTRKSKFLTTKNYDQKIIFWDGSTFYFARGFPCQKTSILHNVKVDFFPAFSKSIIILLL